MTIVRLLKRRCTTLSFGISWQRRTTPTAPVPFELILWKFELVFMLGAPSPLLRYHLSLSHATSTKCIQMVHRCHTIPSPRFLISALMRGEKGLRGGDIVPGNLYLSCENNKKQTISNDLCYPYSHVITRYTAFLMSIQMHSFVGIYACHYTHWQTNHWSRISATLQKQTNQWVCLFELHLQLEHEVNEPLFTQYCVCSTESRSQN